MISKSLSTSRKFAQLSKIAGPLGEFCQLLFPLIVSHVDDYGRMSGDAFTVKVQVFPVSPRSEEEFETALGYLDTARLIDRYEVDGDKFIQVIKFDAHQTGLHKRTESKFPEIPGNSGNPPEIPAQLKRTEEKGTELKGIEGKVATLLPRARTGSGVMAGTLPRDHVRHSWCSERICVPDFLHARFVKAVGGSNPDIALKAFYGDTVRGLSPDESIESDPTKFWPPLVTARWTPRTTNPKTAGNVAAAHEWLRQSGGAQ